MSFVVDEYSHFLKVRGFDKRAKEVLLKFCIGMAEWGPVRVAPGKFVRKMVRIYAAATKDRSEFRFHINQKEELLEHLRAHGGSSCVELREHEPPKAKSVQFKVDAKFTPRDYQVNILEYLTNHQIINVLTLQTGKGKTFCALKAAEMMGVRVLAVIKAQYIEQWIESYEDTMVGSAKNELMVVKGARQLKALIALAQSGELNKMNVKFIIISSTTMYNFIAEYERHGKAVSYDCNPDEICELVGAGVRLVDEAHQMFHLNYRLDLYTHVQKTINLSATLKSSDPFKDKVYRTAFPLHLRYQGAQYDKYIEVKALFYRMKSMKGLRYKARALKSYSHMELEKSIMKNKEILDNYVDMIADIIEEEYIKSREPGQRCLIFAATKKFCSVIRDRLAQHFSDLDIRRFTDEETYANLMEPDIIVSTLQSAGTARDVPGLYVTLMTTALGSREGNEQALGRLRRLKDWPDVTPKFLYLVCTDIDKHLEYHEKKIEYFEDKTLSQKELQLPHIL